MPRATVLDKLAIGAAQSTSVARNPASSLSNVSPPEEPITGGNVRAHLYDIYNKYESFPHTRGGEDSPACHIQAAWARLTVYLYQVDKVARVVLGRGGRLLRPCIDARISPSQPA